MLCFSGQYQADVLGFGPGYDAGDIADITPTCVPDGDGAGLPDPVPGQLRRQYLAFAVRKTAGVTIASVHDVAGIAVQAEDKDGTATMVRSVRWSFEATLQSGSGTLKVLNLHLKTGCFDGFLQTRWWLDGTVWSPDGERDHACDTLARQLHGLRAWVADATASQVPYMLVGDFNRRIDIEDPRIGSLHYNAIYAGFVITKIPRFDFEDKRYGASGGSAAANPTRGSGHRAPPPLRSRTSDGGG